MINLILCGGSGTRLWPISRTLLPKQFVKLFDNQSLFQKTVSRNSDSCELTYVVSNAEQYFLAEDQVKFNGGYKAKYLLEPVGRNTAPAIALACMAVDPEELILVTPSDHSIADQEAYQKVLDEAQELAKEDYLVTFGITPGYAETGYGYIEADGQNVRSFKEKPNAETAQKYLDQGNYYWNSGMFCFKAKVFLEELNKFAPEMYTACEEALEKAPNDGSLIKITHDDMAAIPANSIDYAVMEQSKIVKVIAADIGWNDLGSFESLYNELPKDNDGNTVAENHTSINSENNLIITSDRKVATLDINDLIIVDTPDALLVSSKGSSQKVKSIVENLKESGSDLHHVHRTAYRPWGSYTVIEDTPQYKVKRISVKPGGRLSLQKHYHRSEHWNVVSGTALVTLGEKEFLVRKNESTYIPIGEVHRLENPGKVPLVMIEVQVGEYTGEDDIVRIEDDYKRS